MARIIFITGATSGIGKACAEIFAANGYHLILNGRRTDRLQELKDSLTEKYNIEILLAPFDVQNKEAVFNAVQSFSEKWQSIDVLINNAGLALGRSLFDEAEITDWETMLQTNVTGLLYVSKAILPFMTKRNKGHLINIGSIAGDDMYERGNVYCATKAAVDAISRTMRIDLLPHQIKVTNIKPGAVNTEFANVRFKGDDRAAANTYKGYIPLTGKDIAESIYYCATLPPNVCINELTITCLAQANGVTTYKNQEV